MAGPLSLVNSFLDTEALKRSKDVLNRTDALLAQAKALKTEIDSSDALAQVQAIQSDVEQSRDEINQAKENIADMIDAAGLPGVRPWASKAANYLAMSGDRLQCDTTGGSFSVTLPANPPFGSEVWIYKSGPNDLTISRNGQTITGAAENLVIAADDVEIHLVFRPSTWRY